MMSFAVRWHGSNAALLWEVTCESDSDTGPEVELRSGADAGWRSSSATGEGLLRIDVPISDTSFS